MFALPVLLLPKAVTTNLGIKFRYKQTIYGLFVYVLCMIAVTPNSGRIHAIEKN